MAITKSIQLDALPAIYPSVEAAPKGALIQCRHKLEKESLVGLRVNNFDPSYGREVAGVIPLEGSNRGMFTPQAHFYGFGSFDVSGLVTVNARLIPRANVSQPQTGFLYLDPRSKAVWMWSMLEDRVAWVCMHSANKISRGQMEQGLMITDLIELGEPAVEPFEKV
jgi:hypothetical protein